MSPPSSPVSPLSGHNWQGHTVFGFELASLDLDVAILKQGGQIVGAVTRTVAALGIVTTHLSFREHAFWSGLPTQ